MGRCFQIGTLFEDKVEIIVCRQKRNGTLLAGFFLVDKGCLGLKDTFLVELTGYEALNEAMQSQMDGINSPKEIDPIQAQNIIYGGIEWAEDAGFAPHKDFRLTEYLLDDVEELEYREVEFGRDGQHYYVPGPDDHVPTILKTLEKNLGQGNFQYANNWFTDDFEEDDEDEDRSFTDDFEEDDDLAETANDYLATSAYSRYFTKISTIEDSLETSTCFCKYGFCQ